MQQAIKKTKTWHRFDTVVFALLVLILLGYIYLCNHSAGQGEADAAADEAPSLDALFPRAQSSSLAIDSSGVIRGIHQWVPRCIYYEQSQEWLQWNMVKWLKNWAIVMYDVCWLFETHWLYNGYMHDVAQIKLYELHASDLHSSSPEGSTCLWCCRNQALWAACFRFAFIKP